MAQAGTGEDEREGEATEPLHAPTLTETQRENH
jgi:hypothetical protein